MTKYISEEIAREKYHAIINHIPNIDNPSDVLGMDKNGNINRGSFLFHIIPRVWGKLLSNDPSTIISKHSIKVQKVTCKFVIKIGKIFLNGKKLIIEKSSPIPDNQPIIFTPNHFFHEDAISTLLLIGKPAYFIFGSLPQFFNTINGIAIYLIGSILLNRKNKSSRHAIIEKVATALHLGTNIIFYPEGVWNKSSNLLTIGFYPGVFRAAKKANATVVPIVHLLVEDTIFSSRLPSFDICKYEDEQLALETLQEIMNTELWELMEKYAKTTRADFLGSCGSMNEACELQLTARTAITGKYYDFSIETSADYRNPKCISPIDVWQPIAHLNITPQNAFHVTYAQKLIEQLEQENYQRRF